MHCSEFLSLVIVATYIIGSFYKSVHTTTVTIIVVVAIKFFYSINRSCDIVYTKLYCNSNRRFQKVLCLAAVHVYHECSGVVSNFSTNR